MISEYTRKTLFAMLSGLRHGSLKLHWRGHVYRFGDESAGLQASIRVHRERFFSRVLFGGEDGAGDSFVDGDWSTPDLVSVIRLAVRNLSHLENGNAVLSWMSRTMNRLRHLRRDNSLDGSRRNIHEHYDLSNDFFRLFLDDKMVYSSGIFPTSHSTLEESQIEKIDRLCRKLRLQPGDRLLEIGTGWGACALHAARNYGCDVTTTTISREQYEYSKQLFAESGEAGQRITLLLEDYRNLQGQFDKVISIEMFEAVGLRHYDDFFGACDRLLTPNGTLAMQTITMNERKFDAYRKSSDWIQRRIFPGSELASVREILASLARATNLALFHLEDIGMHYAVTLAEWRRRFHQEEANVRELGFDDHFLRSWDYYLGYCEGAFRERHIGNVQLILTKSSNPSYLYGEPWLNEQLGETSAGRYSSSAHAVESL
jgi:cyclopropane-fatty-acyl-phospholipid synthase